MYGYSAAEALGQRVETILRPADAAHAQAQKRMLAELIDGGLEVSQPLEVARLRKDGTLVWTSVMFTALRGEDGRVEALSGICRDVTESRRATAALLEREQRLTALTERLTRVREEERTRLARRVHDELGQAMTGLALVLRRLRREGPLEGLFEEADYLLDDAVETLQQIAIELRPNTLDAVGLPAAVLDEATRFQKRSGLKVEVQVPEEGTPESRVSTELFRMLQEVLTNVARHAQARSVRIQLEDDWSLRIEDDGVGLPPDAEARPTSLGLLGLRERAASIGGTVQLSSGPSGGTVALIRCGTSS